MVSSEMVAPAKSGLSGGVRFCIAVLIAMALGLFALMWDGGYIPHSGVYPWVGSIVFLPLIAVGLGFGGNCLTQFLSCSQVQWLLQLQRVAIIPVPFLLLWVILYFFPTIRWPIEGLAQSTSPAIRRGLSSGFYTFWIALYSSGFLNGLAQVC